VTRKYSITSRKQDIGRLINQLHREEFLAVGIMDTGTPEDLVDTLDWFVGNFNYCLHVVSQNDRFNVDEMQNKYPDVTFIIFPKAPSLAERVNALADVCMTTYFLTMRSDTNLMNFDWKPLEAKMKEDEHPAMICPWIFNKSNEKIPTIRVPHLQGREVSPLSFMPTAPCLENLYPFLGIGLYDRALFQRLRGYDEEISGAYWQTLDFGVRCWLYGYPIYTMSDIAVLFYAKQFLIEDRTEQQGFERFYSKALAVHQVKGRAYIRKGPKMSSRFINEEVKPRIKSYRTDFTALCEHWKNPE
jgi:GT2 family glycosyltransferase